MEAVRYILTPLLLLSVWCAGWILAGDILVPSPLAVFLHLLSMITDPESLSHVSITVFRGVISLFITYFISLPAGILCGMNSKLMDGISPLITLSQSCPPVLWIALLMIWTGMGGVVPVAVAVITMMPVVFFSTASGVSSIDKDLYAVTKVYRISKPAVLTGVILPSILPSLAGSMSYSLGVVWKVTATAEFFGSPDGIGACLYWSFRLLDIKGLFAWALIIILTGFAIDRVLIRELSEKFLSITGGRK